MSEENIQQEESTQDTSTMPELPVPNIGENSGGQPTSSQDTESIVEAIISKLEPLIDRKVQSTKDKRLAGLEKKVESLSQIEQLEELGVSISDEVKTNLRLKNLEAQLTASQSQPASQGSGAKLTTDDVSKMLSDFQLDANDAEVIGALRGNYNSKDHFTAELGKLAVKKLTQPKPAASSTLSSTSVQSSGPSQSLDEMNARMEQLVRNPTVKGAMEEMAKLGEKIKEAEAKTL